MRPCSLNCWESGGLILQSRRKGKDQGRLLTKLIGQLKVASKQALCQSGKVVEKSLSFPTTSKMIISGCKYKENSPDSKLTISQSAKENLVPPFQLHPMPLLLIVKTADGNMIPSKSMVADKFRIVAIFVKILA